MNRYGQFATIFDSSVSFNCSSMPVKCNIYVFASILQRDGESTSVTINMPSPKELQYKSLSSSMAVCSWLELVLLRNATDCSALIQSFKSSSDCVLSVRMPVFLTICMRQAGAASCDILTQFSNVIIFGFLSSLFSHISRRSIPWRLELNSKQYRW